jgi:hypothetical protein
MDFLMTFHITALLMLIDIITIRRMLALAALR